MYGHPFTSMISAPAAAGWAEVRGERTVAAHAAVEALRMHAAAHDGQLPAQLSDVTIAPVPLDPSTGKPFVYSVAGRTAKITSAAPPGRDPEHFALHFEVTILPRDAAQAPKGNYRMSKSKHRIVLVAVAMILVSGQSAVRAAESAAAPLAQMLAPIVDQQTLLVVHVALTNLQPAEAAASTRHADQAARARSAGHGERTRAVDSPVSRSVANRRARPVSDT